jgi:hypothetical protein
MVLIVVLVGGFFVAGLLAHSLAQFEVSPSATTAQNVAIGGPLIALPLLQTDLGVSR